MKKNDTKKPTNHRIWGEVISDDGITIIKKGNNAVTKILGIEPENDLYFGSPVEAQGDMALVGGQDTVRQHALIAEVANPLANESVYLVDRSLAPDDQHYLVPISFSAKVGENDRLIVMNTGPWKQPTNVTRFGFEWAEQAAILDYICGIDRDLQSISVHPDDPERPILDTVATRLFGTPNSPFINAVAGHEISQPMMQSLVTIVGNNPLWQDVQDCVGQEKAAEAISRARFLAETTHIPVE